MERRLAAILAADMVGYSRLMEVDEVGVLTRQKKHRRELIDPEIERNRGRIVKTTGDGLLAEFSSAIDAVRAAINIQTEMIERESTHLDEDRIQYRCGINVGEVIVDDADIFGGCVNVAARLESMTEPGGVCISDVTFQIVQDSVSEHFEDLGSQQVKNISRAVGVWQWTLNAPSQTIQNLDLARSQRIQFCVTSDDVQLAYARLGSGPTVLKAPNWLNHLDYEWRTPIWGGLLQGLSKNNELIRFDHRGGGMSDWDVEEISFDAMVSDIGTVADAAKLDRFVLFGVSQGCSYSIAYAAQYPEKVRALILLGGFTRGLLKRNVPEAEDLFEAGQILMERGWGSTNPIYRNMFTANFIPDATLKQKAGLAELQRVSLSSQNSARISVLRANIEVGALARQINVPTLVLHAEGDQIAPLEEGRRMAALIPGARFVALEGNNHALVEGSPAFKTFFREVDAFLAELER